MLFSCHEFGLQSDKTAQVRNKPRAMAFCSAQDERGKGQVTWVRRARECHERGGVYILSAAMTHQSGAYLERGE